MDRISELPDDILVDIMSEVKMKEMVQTSVFSKRWRRVWTSMRNLNFDITEPYQLKTEIYVRCVNDVIRHHQAHNIDQFIVAFRLEDTYTTDINSWISFALRKRVQNLKLDTIRFVHEFSKSYTFPHTIETTRSSSLTSLELSGVNITGEVLERFLCDCPNLEFVSVKESETLDSLNVDGRSLKLKWLELLCCPNSIFISLSAPNLVSFKYSGEFMSIPLVNIPKLVELSIHGRFGKYLSYAFTESLSSVVSQLETLTCEACLDKNPIYMRVPVFTNLKYLKLVFTLPYGSYFRMGYTPLIEASPSLYKITLQMPCKCLLDIIEPIKVPRHPHNIKVVEFEGFQGCLTDVGYAIYLIENAVTLEKIVFDTRVPKREKAWKWFYMSSDRDRAFAWQRAEELAKGLPAGVELIIT